jgi:hypothetical protein
MRGPVHRILLVSMICPRKGQPLLVLLLLLFPVACGTLTHGTSQKIACVSNPAGAVVRTADGAACTTPCSVNLKRNKDDTLIIERAGYQPVTVHLHSSLSKTFAGEVLLPGGLICLGIDLASGGAYELAPGSFDINLEPNEIGSEPEMPGD